MFDGGQLQRLKPLLLFWSVYTLIFIVFTSTLKYTLPFLLGFLLAVAIQPFLRLIKRVLHLPPGAAAAVSTLLVYVLIFGLLSLLGFWLIREIDGLLRYLSSIDWEKAAAPLSWIFDRLGEYIGKIDADFIRRNQEQMLKLLQSGAGMLSAVLSAAVAILTSLPALVTMLLVLVCSTFFFSRDMKKAAAHLSGLLTAGAAAHLRSASRQGAAIGLRCAAAYLFLCVVTCLETFFLLSFLHISYPLVFGLAAGAADVLPVVGPGLVYLPLAVAMLLSGRPFCALALLVGWLVFSLVRQILEPKLISSSVNVHPLAMLAAVYISLIAGNILLIFYFSFLFLLYRAFTLTGALPSLFPEAKAQGDKENKSL